MHLTLHEGHTLIIIEHNMDVIKCADYIIDLGPEGGNDGGQQVVTGTPEEVAACASILILGKFLKDKLHLSQGHPKTVLFLNRSCDESNRKRTVFFLILILPFSNFYLVFFSIIFATFVIILPYYIIINHKKALWIMPTKFEKKSNQCKFKNISVSELSECRDWHWSRLTELSITLISCPWHR